MFLQTRSLTLEGQRFTWNQNSNTVILEITQPFVSAGKKLNWDTVIYGVPGLGVNRSIVDFVISRNARLAIIVLSENADKMHWINYDKLRDFKKNNRTEYPVSGKIIHVFPWRLFSPVPMVIP